MAPRVDTDVELYPSRRACMKTDFPEWQRMTILTLAGFIVAFSLFSIWSAAATWTSIPTNPIALGYFFVVLILVPVLAAWSFLFAWQGRDRSAAVVLVAIPAAILLLRTYVIGGF